MRLNINHKTGFRYASRVAASYNEARMTPASTGNQRVWSSRVSIDPAAWSFSYTDYWGTAVTTFEVHERHERLTVQAQAVVETRGDDLAWDTERRVAENDLGWPALQRPWSHRLDVGVPDHRVAYPPAGGVARSGPGSRRSASATGRARHLCPGRRARQLRAGLHQRDQCGGGGVGGRAGGVPGLLPPGHRRAPVHRYPGPVRLGISASGPARRSQRHGDGESHSWVEWWCGSWVAYDPTLRQRMSEQYVRVGHGRDYGDVAPLRGTYSGGASSEMFVTVEMTQLG